MYNIKSMGKSSLVSTVKEIDERRKKCKEYLKLLTPIKNKLSGLSSDTVLGYLEWADRLFKEGGHVVPGENSFAYDEFKECYDMINTTRERLQTDCDAVDALDKELKNDKAAAIKKLDDKFHEYFANNLSSEHVNRCGYKSSCSKCIAIRKEKERREKERQANCGYDYDD